MLSELQQEAQVTVFKQTQREYTPSQHLLSRCLVPGSVLRVGTQATQEEHKLSACAKLTRKRACMSVREVVHMQKTQLLSKPVAQSNNLCLDESR